MMYKCFLSADDMKKILPTRKPDTHKGDFGKILLLCGSQGYTGAAALAAMGALRSGAGLVYLGVPESIYDIEAVKLTEPVIIPLVEEDHKVCAGSVYNIHSLLMKADAVLIGPGLGRSDSVTEFVKDVLSICQCPVVLDADGINAISSNINILRDRKGATILTPHDVEFTRMGFSLSSDRCADACFAANYLNCIILLKGHRTVITDGKTCYINQTGNPGMACGGSGDVLAGVITSLLGQKIDPLLAAACGAGLHGAAGDICAEQIGQYGMLPQDMINALPRLLP